MHKLPRVNADTANLSDFRHTWKQSPASCNNTPRQVCLFTAS